MPRRSDDLSGRFWCGSVVLTNEQKVNNMTIILAVLLLGVIAVAGTKIVKLKNLNRTIDVNLKLSREKVADLTLENSRLSKKLQGEAVYITNNFVGNPEAQAKKVLDVLEASNKESRKEELTKKIEAVEEKVKNAEAKKRADENLESILEASQKASEKAKSTPAAKKKPSSSSRSSSSSDSSSAYLAGGYIAGSSSYDSGSSSSSSSYGCGSSSSSSSFDSGSSFSGGCDSGGF